MGTTMKTNKEMVKELIKEFVRALSIDDFDTLMNAIANEFGFDEIANWVEEHGGVI